MAYEKRLCVLKQMKKGFSADGSALSGAVYAERMGSELTVTARILGLAPVKEGRYALAVRVGETDYQFDLSDGDAHRVSGAPSLKDGFSALVCFVRGEAEPVAFGYCGNAGKPEELLAAFREEKKGRKRIPVPLPPTEIPGIPSPQAPLAPAVPLPDPDGGYDDEAISEANYYREADDDGTGDENEAVACGDRHAEEEKSGGGDARENEADGGAQPFRIGGAGLTYYRSVREKIGEAFRRYPRDETLRAAFPHSEWVNGGGALLGVIYESGVPRYLCVAKKAQGDPPEEMRESGIFVPTSPFTETDGYYVVFQDADTGEIVRTYDA
ncbi:MAG: hypothetical protein ACI4NG_03720 [Candidatus Gallimonas sp.]